MAYRNADVKGTSAIIKAKKEGIVASLKETRRRASSEKKSTQNIPAHRTNTTTGKARRKNQVFLLGEKGKY